MQEHQMPKSEILDDTKLTVDQLAKICQVQAAWVVERVEAGILSYTLTESTTWYFTSAELIRARRLVSIERDFDANQELAAIVTDLIEEVMTLKHRLNIAGIKNY